MNNYENHNLKNEKLPFICKEISGYPIGNENWHENIEVICFLKGEGTVLHNGERFSVSEGDTVIINSNCLHGILSTEKKITFRYLIVDRSFCIENGFDTSQLSFDCVVNNDRIRELMNRLASEFTCADSLPFFTLRIRATVLEIMMELCIKHSKDVPDTENTSRSATCKKSNSVHRRSI